MILLGMEVSPVVAVMQVVEVEVIPDHQRITEVVLIIRLSDRLTVLHLMVSQSIMNVGIRIMLKDIKRKTIVSTI